MGPVNPTKLSFDFAGEYTDETVMPITAVSRFEYGFSQNPQGPFNQNVITDVDFTPENQKQVCPLDFTKFTVGQWYGAGRTVSKESVASQWSNVAAFEVKAREPKPPQAFTVG